jgi:hypothetical protein
MYGIVGNIIAHVEGRKEERGKSWKMKGRNWRLDACMGVVR